MDNIDGDYYNDTEIAGVFYDDNELYTKTALEWTSKYA
jgi:hypothetical protein